ncbi:MAG: membrane-bound lytic murein transglycosylase MltF [Ignavibacteriae bacterium]|nr:membrane-bound lytic murein transglycosylase MltF [Ignavibacteriota bacterium]NOH00274.1 membrane-bound lytic murein transglycosylase MltF [Ignavibacteriota bacterium]
MLKSIQTTLIFTANLFLILSILILSSCQSDHPKSKEQKPKVSRDLEEIKKEGVLRVSTTYSSTSYFLYRGEPMGFEYELLERFAEYLGVELEINIAQDIDSLIYNLNYSDIDLVAHGLTITSERKKRAAFTDYLYYTNQVLVQRQPDDWRTMKWSTLQRHLIHDAIELIGDTVSVRKNSAYLHRLKNLSREIGGTIFIDTLEGNFSTDEIIEMVVDKKIKYTVADKNIASINKAYYPILNIKVPISFSQRIAWAVSSNSNNLLKAANDWLKEAKNEVDYFVIYNKYFKNSRSIRKRVKSDFFSLNKNQISKYDKLIKKHAAKINWDWRLLASLIYQESRFKPKAASWAKAKGLMQIMPATAKELGVTDRTDPEQSIRGGTEYLKILWNRFDEIQDSLQRIKFTMASYNCGINHVIDAQKLAEKHGNEKFTWDDNVDKMLLNLSYPKYFNDPVVKYGYVKGAEPYTYVEQIFERYEHYKKFIN